MQRAASCISRMAVSPPRQSFTMFVHFVIVTMYTVSTLIIGVQGRKISRFSY
jgi:hypothetical protein